LLNNARCFKLCDPVVLGILRLCAYWRLDLSHSLDQIISQNSRETDMSENLKFSMLEGHIGELILSQPKRRNALNAAMWADLPKILRTAENTNGIKALIVRGEGDHFASGADISEFETLYATQESSKRISDDINAGFKALAEFPYPVIAMVRGACVGAVHGGRMQKLVALVRRAFKQTFA
jgi:1,4-dihydroxy-2-naphthoyl-CoA synthase